MDKVNIIAERKTKTVYRDGDKVIKLFAENYSKADILNEALNQARVEETNIKIPKLLEVKKIGSQWAIVLEYVEGKTLEQLIKENPDKLDEYLDMFVELQLDIQDQKCPLLNKLKDKMNRKISEVDLCDITKYELHMRLDAMPKHTKVCHGDFNPSNIIVTPEGIPYVIDWAHATQGNASADVARTYLLFNLSGQPELAEKYLNAFCEHSCTEKRYVQKWVPIVAASQMVKGKSEEYDLLSKWVDVVEYE